MSFCVIESNFKNSKKQVTSERRNATILVKKDKKSLSDSCLRDSGFFDRISLASQSSDSDQSTSSMSRTEKLQIDFHHHHIKQHGYPYYKSSLSSSSDARSYRDYDSDSIRSTCTLTDSLEDSDNGLCIYVSQKLARKRTSRKPSNQNSMFNSASTSHLYFPNHSKKADMFNDRLCNKRVSV
ncbi:hypothetical protein EB796_007973 [Bugula neritina]|uniref:Uncharacterized protein n=1 Tax=Bugula neritina TaxID=10212 RepID=A0A7J7K645_BUGNE|nr:hypothetical protein EB796_007973 [Bugula neritina]